MKKVHLDKISKRLQSAQEIFSDKKRTKEIMTRIKKFGKGSDLHNKVEMLFMLLNTDIPELIEFIIESKKPKKSEDEIPKDFVDSSGFIQMVSPHNKDGIVKLDKEQSKHLLDLLKSKK